MSRPRLVQLREPGPQDTNRVVAICACYSRCTVPLTPRLRYSLSFGQPTGLSSRDFFSTHTLHQIHPSKQRLRILCEACPRVSHPIYEQLLKSQNALLSAALSQREPHCEALSARKRKEFFCSTHCKLQFSTADEKRLRRGQCIALHADQLPLYRVDESRVLLCNTWLCTKQRSDEGLPIET